MKTTLLWLFLATAAWCTFAAIHAAYTGSWGLFAFDVFLVVINIVQYRYYFRLWTDENGNIIG